MIYPINYRGSSNHGEVVAIVGMQFGSEGKGAIAAHLANTVDFGVRSGAANAGHTIYYKGHRYVMRQVPTTWINPRAKLVIGAGSLISLDVLLQEIKVLSGVANIKSRLYVDHRAHVITPEQIEKEQATDLASRIGSTSALSREGIGVAASDKVLRKESCVQAKDHPDLTPYLADTVDMLNTSLDGASRVLLEGTQGFDLSLDFGHFPYVTSRDTSAGALFASVGIAPHRFSTEIIGVVRTYPIRVAGNSGPFGEDSEELSWGEVARRAGATEDITERTSVTGNVRRVATFSKQGFKRACDVNRPTCIALTFADYLDWSVHNQERITKPVEEFMGMIRGVSGVGDISFVKTGPDTVVDFEMMKVQRFWKTLLKRAI
ncbi:MAG: adenylosuccinate synthetase [Patescibacteria group bacterium]